MTSDVDTSSPTTATPALERLFSPFPLGELTLRNRIVSPPHATGFVRDGLPTDQQVAYYEEIARGGAGFIVAGSWAAWPRTMSSPGGENLPSDPRALDGHRRIAEAVHRNGSLISAQLHVAGRQGSSGWHRKPLLAPSPLADPVQREIPKELEPDEIDDLVENFGRAAVAMKAGDWDGVEIFSAQGYGLAQFLSPQVNRRTDDYGGGLDGRMRLLLRVVDAVRDAVGAAFTVGVRMNASDFIDGGLTIEESKEIACRLEAAAKIDYLSISGASNENWPLWIADMSHPLGLFVSLAAQIREVVSLPLLVVTRIKDPVHAEAILRDGHADLIGMNRALIADPQLPRKAREGRLDDIRPCVGCNQGCLGRVLSGQSFSCTVNPRVGYEREAGSRAAAVRRRRVVVIGGGPAGLEAAVGAAERGHGVILYEERERLGGQIALAARVESRAEFGTIVDYLARRAAKLGVEIRRGRRATVEDVAADGPDAVVLATGSEPLRTGFSSFRPSVDAIPGHDLPHVVTCWEVLEQSSSIGARVLIVDDDPHVQATTAAEFLSALGKHVTIVCRSPYIGAAIGHVNHGFLYKRLFTAGVELLENTWVEEITAGGARGFNVYTERPVPLDGFDTVVLATGNRVRAELYPLLRLRLPSVETVRIGDCLAPRKLDQAIWDGFHAALAI